MDQLRALYQLNPALDMGIALSPKIICTALIRPTSVDLNLLGSYFTKFAKNSFVCLLATKNGAIIRSQNSRF